jgi:DnaJ-class molecular chaperone
MNRWWRGLRSPRRAMRTSCAACSGVGRVATDDGSVRRCSACAGAGVAPHEPLR